MLSNDVLIFFSDSQLANNGKSGLHFNPFIPRLQQRELRGWLKLIENKYISIPGDISELYLKKDQPQILITKTLRNSTSTKFVLKIRVSKNVDINHINFVFRTLR